MDVTQREELIASAPPAEGAAKLWVLGRWRTAPIKLVPISALILNVENRRFVAERELFQQKLGHALDPENNEADALSVESILLDQNRHVDGDRVVGKPDKDSEALRKDWLRREQESPFWIHADGSVRNGNRRLAMLRRVNRDPEMEGYQHVEAVILDDLGINEPAIFEMEQREQLTEDYKVRYTDINLLLAIRDAAADQEIDWHDPVSIADTAGKLQHVIGNDPGYAIVQLYAIRYMDEYLRDLELAGRYDRLIGQIERFREVGKTMRALEGGDEDCAPAMLNVLFAAVNAGLTHLKIRQVRRLFNADRDEFAHLAEHVGTAEEQWTPPTDEEALGAPDVVDDEVDDPDMPEERDDSPGPVVTNYPKEAVRGVFEDALDRHAAAQTADILRIVREVNNRLQALISEDSDRLGPAMKRAATSELPDAVRVMSSWFERHGPALK